MSLYDHLVKVFEHFILHSPDKAVERFEEISYLIKQGRDPNEFFQCNDIRNYQSLAEESKEYVEKTMEYFPAQEIDDEGNVAQPDPLATQVQDMMAESRIFAWAGIGFGEQETYRLQKSIKKLAAAKPHSAIRFFGKIYGTEKDYYVVECKGEVAADEDEAPVDGGEDAEPDPLLEPAGTGVNELTYYVT